LSGVRRRGPGAAWAGCRRSPAYVPGVYGGMHGVGPAARWPCRVVACAVGRCRANLGTYDSGTGAFAPWNASLAREVSVSRHWHRGRGGPAEPSSFLPVLVCPALHVGGLLVYVGV
jgi:hypothetical protein